MSDGKQHVKACMKISQTRDHAHGETNCFSAIYVAVKQEWKFCNESILLHGIYEGQVFNIVNLFQGVLPMYFTKYE